MGIEELQRFIDEAKAHKAEAARYKRILIALVLANGKDFKLPFNPLTSEQADSLEQLVKTHQVVIGGQKVYVAPTPVSGGSESEIDYLTKMSFIFEEDY